MTVLISDALIINGLAQGLYDVDFSGADPVPVPSETTAPATVTGSQLGTAMVTTVDQMGVMLNAQGTRLAAIAQIFEDTDSKLGVGVSS
jgi:hypothetical protein